MPELPEVQTTVNGLAKVLPGRTVTNAWMDPVKSIHTGSNLAWPTIKRLIRNHQIATVTRRAKYIVINFSDGSKLWIHQKMTGHLLMGSWRHTAQGRVSKLTGPLHDDPTNRYIRLLLTLDNTQQMALSDARRFARIIFTRSDDEIGRVRELANLGPEPLTLSVESFATILSRARGPIKPMLMDPSRIVGIGNIYASEILYDAHIHPFRRAHNLSRSEVTAMHHSMRTILTAAIQAGGSSTDDYRTPDGQRGGYQNYHRAYNRAGQPCTLCRDGIIKKIVHNGRSSYFCNTHQQ